ncbi:MAG TPA: MerR family transcriptional regulator [Acidimicrobiales bacterium]|nr:MerR family transcriptional regulator [Acidimicrobiales bacterium]
MTMLRIAEVAERSGFSPPTLRYYESIGLLPAPERAGNGYRVYADGTLDRLACIARAKQLGCTLDEIAEILGAAEGGHCAPVQERLSALVGGKIADARTRIVELTTLVADLQRSAAVLSAHTPDGPCDDRCGCISDPGSVAPAPVALVAKPDAAVADDPPVACTLGAGDMQARLGDWQDLLAHVTDRTAVDRGLRLTFDPATPLDRIAALAAAEHDCCRFFRFALTVDHRGVALEVRAPDDAGDVVTALFGAVAAAAGAPA